MVKLRTIFFSLTAIVLSFGKHYRPVTIKQKRSTPLRNYDSSQRMATRGVFQPDGSD